MGKVVLRTAFAGMHPFVIRANTPCSYVYLDTKGNLDI